MWSIWDCTIWPYFLHKWPVCWLLNASYFICTVSWIILTSAVYLWSLFFQLKMKIHRNSFRIIFLIATFLNVYKQLFSVKSKFSPSSPKCKNLYKMCTFFSQQWFIFVYCSHLCSMFPPQTEKRRKRKSGVNGEILFKRHRRSQESSS